MLIIRNEQLEVFDDYLFKQFVEDMIAHLRTNFPNQVKPMNETDLRKMIEDGIDRAEQYDVINVGDVERFLECMVILGQNFDNDIQNTWAGDILRDKNTNGTDKMDEIMVGI
jgi:hypothetical protein